ncbi:MarC family protein [Streptomyces sp. NPDC048434]|uniref:MarC family protein n=1 Tax=Streptomyces sp. NPDC048434 TaxID=3365549 RepID=UPI003715E962
MQTETAAPHSAGDAMSTVDLTIQATISMILLVDPFIRGVFFRLLTENEPERRREYVGRIMVTIAITLGVSALVGKELLDLVGINLGAFGLAGGLVLALMGFEMLFAGDPSRAQGGARAHEEPEPKSAEDSIVVPYAIPFMAGPGAITAVITISSAGSGWSGPIAALIAVGITVALIPVGHLFLANKVNLSPQSTALMTRFGGLFVATIGIQLMLGGIKTYFGIS